MRNLSKEEVLCVSGGSDFDPPCTEWDQDGSGVADWVESALDYFKFKYFVMRD